MSEAGPPRLPEFGLGAAGLGNLYTALSDDEAEGALDAAWESGLTYIDTAPYYGHGLSEQRVGAWLATSGAKPALSTKVGRRLESANGRPLPDHGFASPAPNIPAFDYSADGIRAAFAGSQQRLGVQSVDILLLHDIGALTHGDAHEVLLAQALEEALPEMAALKAEGCAQWIGLGVNEIEVCRAVLEYVDLDVLLLAGRYTLLEHQASAAFLDECHQRGVKVIIGGAFNSGLLAASGDMPQRYDYDDAPEWALQRVGMLRKVCAAFDVDLPAAALQFCRAHPAVASVIPGARTADEVKQVARWTQAKIDPELWIAMRDLGLVTADAVVPS